MAYIVQLYPELQPACAAIRTAVFVEEQGFQQEFDDIDKHAWHVLVFDGSSPIATGRVYTTDENIYHIGRIAVLPAYRGKHIGQLVVSALEQKALELGGTMVALSAQCRAAAFYEKLGYMASGEAYLDEFCPHIHMTKTLPAQ